MSQPPKAPLTREQKLELIAALEEKQRRERARKPLYKPNAGQLPIHQCKSLNRFIFSGNGAGKTTLLVNELAWRLKGFNPITGEHYPIGMRIAVVVDNTKKIGEVVLSELRKWHELPDEWLKRDGKPHVARIINDRCEISFYSIEADPMLAEGTSLHEVFADEPIPRHLYVAFKRSLRLKDYPGRFTFSGTPIGQPWLRTDIYDKWVKGELPDTECFRVSTYVNIDNLGKDGIDSFARALSEQEKKTRLEGAFFDSDAQALAHLWRRDIHIVKQQDLNWQPNWPVVIGLDPHPVKEHVAVMVGATPSNHQIIIKELSRKLTARQFANELAKWMDGYRVVDIVCDSLGSTDGTGNEGFASFITVVNETLRGLGRPGVRATTYEDKSHEAAIDRLQTGLLIPDVADNFGNKLPKLRVMENCRGVIDNIETVGWVKNRLTGEMKPKLDTSTKDYLSATCYALAANVNFSRGTERPVYLKKSPYEGLSLKSERAGNRFRRRYPMRRTAQLDDDDD